MEILNHPFFIATVFASMFIEFLLSKKLKLNVYTAYEFYSNFVFMVTDRIIVIFTGAEGGPLGDFLFRHRLFDFHFSRPVTMGLTFLAAELMYFMVHYYNHYVNIGWATHIMHHSPTKYNLSLAYRLGLTRFWSLAWLMIVPLVLLGFNPKDLAWWAGVTLIGQFFIHTELIGKLGFLDLIFNTPSNHRVHHSSNPDHYNKNLGGMTMIFDHLFGTYCRGHEGAMEYGIPSIMAKKSIVHEIFCHWKVIFRRLKIEKGFVARFLVLFGSSSKKANARGSQAASAKDTQAA